MSIEIMSIEDDDSVAYVIAATFQLEGFSVTRAKEGRTVAKSNAFVDLSPAEYRLLLFSMKNAGRILTY